MKNKLIMAVQGDKHHKFQNFVCSRMAIARSNEKNQKEELPSNEEMEETETQSKKKLSKESYLLNKIQNLKFLIQMNLK